MERKEMKTGAPPIKVFVNVPTITKGQFQEIMADRAFATVESVLRKLIEDSNVPLSLFLESGQWKKDYIIIVNGTITRDANTGLKDQDRVLVTTMMGGG
jgi:molybdopterin converting factor small subunit